MEMVKDALDQLRGATMIVYPMGLPPYDPIRMEFENKEDLSGTQVCGSRASCGGVPCGADPPLPGAVFCFLRSLPSCSAVTASRALNLGESPKLVLVVEGTHRRAGRKSVSRH